MIKRPMLGLAAAWLCGLLVAKTQLPFGKSSFFLISIILIIILIKFLKKYPNGLDSYISVKRYPQMTLFLFCIPILFFLAYVRMDNIQNKIFQNGEPWSKLEMLGETHVFVEGVIEKKYAEEDNICLILQQCSVMGYQEQKSEVAGGCQITLEQEGTQIFPETFVGNKVKVYGKFSVYKEATNEGQFQAFEYYSGKGIYASVKALRLEILDETYSVIGHQMFVLKQKMRKTLLSLYPKEKAGVLTAMLLGDKDLLDMQVKELYQKNGISHILAISGLHISMLCMGLFRLLGRIGSSIKVSSFVTVGFLILYICYTGGSTSSLRAGIMCIVLLGGKLLRRSYDLLSSLALAAILVTAVRPTQVTSAGFLLSFGAVLGVAIASAIKETLVERKNTWWSFVLFSGMIQLVTTPILVWFYYELSPYSILLNFIVLPLVSFVLGGGIVSVLLGLFIPFLAKLPAGGTYILLSFYEWLGEQAQKFPYAFVLVGRPNLWQVVLYYVILLFVVWKVVFVKKKEENYMDGICFCIGIAVAVSCLFLPRSYETEIVFLDVSQGDAMFLQTESGKTLLFDCGSSDVSKVGMYRLTPMLKQRGIPLLDIVSVSHMDSDHVNGVKQILEEMPIYQGERHFKRNYEGKIGIKVLILPSVLEPSEDYLALVALAKEKNVKVVFIEAGDILYKENGILIECLFPSNAIQSENNTSLVYLLQMNDLVVWMMGDAGVVVEQEIVEKIGAMTAEQLQEKFCILKVGHHGSKTSSGNEFIQAVQPDVSIISCGYQNSYGHPHIQVLEVLEEIKSQIWRTDLQGAIHIKKKEREWQVKSFD